MFKTMKIISQSAPHILLQNLPKLFLCTVKISKRKQTQYSYLQKKKTRKVTYLEPNFEIESGAGMAGGVKKAKSNAAINPTTDQHSDLEAFMRHATGQVRLKADIEALCIIRRWKLSGRSHRGRDRKGSEGKRSLVVEEREIGFKRDRRRHRHHSHYSQHSHCSRHCWLLQSSKLWTKAETFGLDFYILHAES